MKRNLAFLFLAVASAALAQTPAAVEKPKPTTVSVAKVSAKPAAGKATTSAQKPATPAKAQPVVVSVAPAAKPSATTQPKADLAKAKPAAMPQVKPAASAAKPAVSATPAVAHPAPAAKGGTLKPSAAPVPTKKSVAVAKASVKPAPKAAVSSVPKVKSSGSQEAKNAEKTEKPKAMNAVGRRDPFTSPVVSMGPTGSGCSTGKRCLAIDQIALRGVVKSDTGMIAVVVNSLDKAYFLRENDPVFNGYVVRITGDSIIFKETLHDRLGKTLTRDVTKSISRPAA